MKIYGGGIPQRPERVREGTPGAGEAVRERASAGAERADRVEISAAGRARAEALAPATGDPTARLAEIRRRLRSDAYETESVMAEIARRLVARGDV